MPWVAWFVPRRTKCIFPFFSNGGGWVRTYSVFYVRRKVSWLFSNVCLRHWGGKLQHTCLIFATPWEKYLFKAYCMPWTLHTFCDIFITDGKWIFSLVDSTGGQEWGVYLNSKIKKLALPQRGLSSESNTKWNTEKGFKMSCWRNLWG